MTSYSFAQEKQCKYIDKKKSHLGLVQFKPFDTTLDSTLKTSPNPKDVSVDHINLLPREILLLIFSYLDVVYLCRSAQVSKAWNALALDGKNWQCVDLFDWQKDVVGPVLTNLAKRCGGFLKVLSLNGCKSVQDSSICFLAENCPNIEILNLNGCSLLTDAMCKCLGTYCNRLVKLDLTSCFFITSDGLKVVSHGCPDLKYIDISWCNQVTDAGVISIAEGCPNLKRFMFRGCDQVTATSFECLTEKCRDLEVVIAQRATGMSDDCLRALGQFCSQLVSLTVDGCTRISDQGVRGMAAGCRKLKFFDVGGCVEVTDAGVSAVARNCHLLEKVDLEDCLHITNTSLFELAINCPRLAHLALSHCDSITDNGIKELTSSSCRDTVQCLELDNCSQLTDTCLTYLGGLPNLTRLDLFDCHLLGLPALKKFQEKHPNVKVHSYFAPPTPEQTDSSGVSHNSFRCCSIL